VPDGTEIPPLAATLTMAALDHRSLQGFEAGTRLQTSRDLPSSLVQLHISFRNVFVTHHPETICHRVSVGAA
jgi:hypothetical protein